MSDGGFAFPSKDEDGGGGYTQHFGMSLRDWFAGQALNGHCANHEHSQASSETLARWCYQCADAMLKARKK